MPPQKHKYIALHIPTSNNGYHVKLSSDHSVGYPHFLLETPTYHWVLHTHQSSIGTHGNNNPFIRHPFDLPPLLSWHAMRRSQSTGREPADLHQGHPPPVTQPVRVASQAVAASLEAPMYLHYYPVPYFVALRDALDFLLPTSRSLCQCGSKSRSFTWRDGKRSPWSPFACRPHHDILNQC